MRSVTVFKKRVKKKVCDRKRYKANRESMNESAKARYWLDPESMKDSAKAYYNQNRELILASKQDQYQANPNAKRDCHLKLIYMF